ncbi:MAG: hypothetical protein RML95_04055 [Anaerolineae bacterium]|nr:hypothetical protein [Anaerolineae bacterium]
MPKRIWMSVVLLCAALSATLSVTIGVVRATHNEYACLQFYYNTRQNWVLDLNSGVYLHDRRLTGSPLDIRRGAVSPDGAYVAYVTQAYTGLYSLYVQPNDAPLNLHMPSFCTDMMTCWRAQPPTVTARRLQANTHWIGMGWSPDSALLGYVWLVRNGTIKATAHTPAGKLVAEQDVAGEHFIFHGWSPSGRYLLFSTQDRLEPVSQLTLHFWSPYQNALHSYKLGDVRGRPPQMLFSSAPQAERAAVILADGDGALTLYLVSARNGVERRESLPPHIDWRANWSPTGDALGLYHFDPPYWHFSIYEVSGAVHRSVGGVTTGASLAKRDGLREFYWSVDGKSAAFLQPNRDDTSALVRYRLADRQIVPIRQAVLSAYESHTKGRVALVRRNGAQVTLEILDVQSGAAQPLATRQNIREVLWLRGADALSFIAESGGALHVEHADLSRNAVRTLFRAWMLYESLYQEPATDFLTMWWRSEHGQVYLDAYTPNGERAYRYRLLGARESRAPIIFSTADKRAAVIFAADETETRYTQIALGDGEHATMIDSPAHYSITALWSPDGKRVALVTSPLSNAPAKARQRLRVLDSYGNIHYDFRAITVGLLHAWTRCG